MYEVSIVIRINQGRKILREARMCANNPEEAIYLFQENLFNYHCVIQRQTIDFIWADAELVKPGLHTCHPVDRFDSIS